MRVNAITVKPFQKSAVGSLQARARSMFLPRRPRIGPNLSGKMLLPSQRLWERGTQGSGATTASRNTMVASLESEGAYLPTPNQGCLCATSAHPLLGQCWQARKRLRLQKISAKLSCSRPRLLPMPGGCRQACAADHKRQPQQGQQGRATRAGG